MLLKCSLCVWGGEILKTETLKEKQERGEEEGKKERREGGGKARWKEEEFRSGAAIKVARYILSFWPVVFPM